MTSRRGFIQACSVAAVAIPPGAAAGTDPVLQKAMESMLKAVPLAERDPERPDYHFRPPANWTNDPNGTIFYKGWHHLFYQLNPYGSLWGHMHWGHARSRDLVNWEHLPIAIGPSEEKGETAIFSGAAILGRDGRPRVFYTSIGNREPEQWMALPEDDDLIAWTKYPRNPVVGQAAHPKKVDDWRDPFLFREAGRTYMVCGGNMSARRQGGTGVVEIYRAQNPELTVWKYLGPLFEYREREVFNIECPNLFRLGNKWVLIFSPHKPCEYFVGTLDLKQPRFIPESHGVLDAGNAYASNISVDDKGRTILWLWGRTENPEAKGWNGVMTIPRILTLGSDGFLRQQPAPEFEKLRDAPMTWDATALGRQPAVIPGLRGNRFEAEFEIVPGRAGRVGVELRRSAQGKAGATITISPDGIVALNGAGTLVGRTEKYRLRVFADKRVVEVFVNDGQAAVYGIANAGPEDLGVAAFSEGEGAKLSAGRGWSLKPAEFSMERFRA